MDSDTYYLKKYLKYKIKYLTYKNNNLVGGDFNDIIKILFEIIIKINNDQLLRSDPIIEEIFKFPNIVIFDDPTVILYCELFKCIICNYLNPSKTAVNISLNISLNASLDAIEIIAHTHTGTIHDFLVNIFQTLTKQIPCSAEIQTIIINHLSHILTINIPYKIEIDKFTNKFNDYMINVKDICHECEVAAEKDISIDIQELKKLIDNIPANITHIGDNLNCFINGLQHDTKDGLCCMRKTFHMKGGDAYLISQIISNTMNIIDKLENYDDDKLYNYLNIKIKNHNLKGDLAIQVIVYCIHLLRIFKNIFMYMQTNLHLFTHTPITLDLLHKTQTIITFIDKILILIFYIKCQSLKINIIGNYLERLSDAIKKDKEIHNKKIKIIIISIFNLLITERCLP